MGSGIFKKLVLLGSGVGLGLGVGALLWRTDPGPPEDLRMGGVLQVGSSHGDGPQTRRDRQEAVGARAPEEAKQTRAVRLEGLARLFRQSGSTRNAESLQHFSEVLAGISVLSGDDFPLLFRLMEAEGKLDEERAVIVLLRWAGEDPRAALDFALGRGEFKESERVISALMYQLAKVDVLEAKASLPRFPEKSEELRDARRAIVSAMMQKNPRGALDYARELQDAHAVDKVLTEWSRTAPLLAAAELDPSDPAQRPALEAVANALLARDRGAFDAWAAGLTDDLARRTIRRLSLTSEAMADPAKAAQDTAAWLNADPVAAGSVGDQLPTHIAQRWWWTKAPPQEVADWAAALPAGTSKDAAVGEVARLWVEKDVLGASGWIDGLPAGAGRDMAVNRLVSAIWKEAPADAFVWACTIQDNTLRWPLLRDSIAGWAAVEPAAALAAVEALPVEQRGDLLEILSKSQSNGRNEAGD